MTKFYPITLQVALAEKAFALYEVNEQAPDNSGMRRYQVILVNRGDKLAEYRVDMGKAKKWENTRFINVPSLWEHSVVELQYIANQIRDESVQDELDLADLLDREGKLTKYF